MPSKAVRLAAVLILAASQTVAVERALARGGSSGAAWGGSHFVGTGHFAPRQFSHRFRKNPVFPFGWGCGWDWPYADYGEAPSAPYANTTFVGFPPPLTAVHAVTNCRWDEQTFNAPASAGGTRPVQVVSCR